MANFAFVENEEIQGLYDILPSNWKNYSNFHALENETEYLKSIGWFKIEHITTDYNTSTHTIGKLNFQIIDNKVISFYDIVEKQDVFEAPSNEENTIRQWAHVREQRDRKITEMDWRVNRYQRELRLGITPTDDITLIDEYIQALADIPTTQLDPFNIIWPEYIPHSGDA